MANITDSKDKITLKEAVSGAMVSKDVSDSILKNFNSLVTQNALKFPKGYNLGNELKLAYLSITNDPQKRGCTPNSIGRALTDLVLQGLQIEKNQAYFIKFKNKAGQDELKLFRSYFGDVAAAKSTGLVKDISAVEVHKGDKFVIGIEGDQRVVKDFETSFENLDNPIIGAYAVATLRNGEKKYCIMTKKEIDTSWNKSKSFDRNVQKDFPQEMAKRTVIRRLVKMIFNTDNRFIGDPTIEAFNRTTENEFIDATKLPSSPKKEEKTNVSNSIKDDSEDAPVDLEEDDLPWTEDDYDQGSDEDKEDDEIPEAPIQSDSIDDPNSYAKPFDGGKKK